MNTKTWIVLLGACVLTISCGGRSRQVQRVGTAQQIDLSGNWNDTDARLTSEALIAQCFGAAWLGNFKDDEGRRPAVRVRSIVNKSDEHIDAQVFVKNIERAMVNSGKVKVLAQTGSELGSVNAEQAYGSSGWVSDDSAPSVGNQTGGDFVLTGRVASVLDQLDGERVKLYKVTFELIHSSNGEKVWIGDHEIKKYTKQKGTSW